jgi:hypothetical protein
VNILLFKGALFMARNAESFKFQIGDKVRFVSGVSTGTVIRRYERPELSRDHLSYQVKTSAGINTYVEADLVLVQGIQPE